MYTETYTAVIVDDHPFIRAAVRMALERERFEIIAEADNGIDALQLVRGLDPDLVVLDLSMPGLDGIEVVTRIRALKMRTRFLVLTSLGADYYSLRCMKMGAAGYVCKTNDLPELSKAVRAIMSGFSYFPDVSLSSVYQANYMPTEAECIASLTDREMRILQYLAQGHKNQQIGEVMNLSAKTVSTHKTRLIEKLRVKSVVDLADIAKRHLLL
ncbi:response regulator transcription factor [Pseudomonas sp. HR96]|uniref:response regulator transcription factor n=1 Tax=Pseudomonas sp. HR96 TaxID=1027966 RepID=UPI002A749B60|nr:response regulator transcription factor [Pseudomonas sp. HR96]WPO98142.1 response regulator transcription factor [Pseudomonas sp. HR96]